MTKAKQQWEAEMGRLNSKYNLVSQIQSWTQNQMRENSIVMNMVIRHSYKNEKKNMNLSSCFHENIVFENLLTNYFLKIKVNQNL